MKILISLFLSFLLTACSTYESEVETSIQNGESPDTSTNLLTIENYEQAIDFDDGLKSVLNSGNDYVVLVFQAYWCSPCREINHMLDAYNDSDEFKVHVSEINMNPELSELFEVNRLPTTYLLTKNDNNFEVYTSFSQIPPEPYFEIYVDYWLQDIPLDDIRVLNDWRLNDYE